MKIEAHNMIEKIMDKFPFDKVQKQMEEMEWKWIGVGVPSVKDLRATAWTVLRGVAEEWGGSESYFSRCSTGGLEAVFWYGEIELRFVPYFTCERTYLQQ